MDRLVKKLKLISTNIKMAISSLGWKRDSSIVLFGAWFGDKFADNTRFLYQYLTENKDKFNLSHVVWVSREREVVENLNNMGYEAYLMDAERSIYFHKMAKYHFICNSSNGSNEVLKGDIQTEYSWGAKRINLWHAVIGFKSVGFDSHSYLESKRKNYFLYVIRELLHKNCLFRKFVEKPGGWGDCYYLVNSPKVFELQTQTFLLPKKNFIETGEPRVSCSVRLLPIEERVLKLLSNYQYSIIYLPTFRDYPNCTVDFNEPGKVLCDYLKHNNCIWIQKTHSASTIKNDDFFFKDNVLNLPSSFDINTIIPRITLMISDFSSAVGDAMYFYKPIIYYIPDYEQFKHGVRGFMDNAEEKICGPKVYAVRLLEYEIDKILKRKFEPDEHYIAIRNLYFGRDRNMEHIWLDILENTK